MPTLAATFTNLQGGPCTGYVALTPLGLRASVINSSNTVGNTRIVLTLNSSGAFTATVEPGDYRVDVCVDGALTISREISVPNSGSGSIDLKTLMLDYLPMPSEQTTTFTSTGPYSYTIPWWATKVDIVLLGGGGGGDDGTTLTIGDGGGAGGWFGATVTRGTTMPWTTTSIAGQVGAGGARNEGNGTTSTASATGMPSYTAAGGTGGAATNSTGISPGTYTFNTKAYKGGAAQPGLGAAGYGPGGGGGGGAALNNWAGAGAAGAVWIRAWR